MGVMIPRFAPSPSGYLHLGHAYAAWVAAAWSDRMLLRIEDIDQTICRDEYREAIYADLDWLGIRYRPRWPEQVDQQSRLGVYQAALARLREMDVVYPCFCSRQDIRRAAITQAPHGMGIRYPGTCRGIDPAEAAELQQHKPFSFRLDAERAHALAGHGLFEDLRFGTRRADLATMGDMVIARKDGLISYHLAVVCDDADQAIELVTRGEDLLPVTDLHVMLQGLLGLPTPRYLHHHLQCDGEGVRLAKRADAESIRAHRRQGRTPARLWAMTPRAASDFPEGFRL